MNKTTINRALCTPVLCAVALASLAHTATAQDKPDHEQDARPNTVTRVIPAVIENGVVITPQREEVIVLPPPVGYRALSAERPKTVTEIEVVEVPPRERWVRAPDVFRSVVARGGVWHTPEISVCWESMEPEFIEARLWTELAVT